jgi:hypothetical protein
MAPPFSTELDSSPVVRPPPETCASWSHQPPQLVVASCRENISWAVAFVKYGYRVTILEKCRRLPEENDDGGVGGVGGGGGGGGGGSGGSGGSNVEWISLPNVGREAHAYLWFIVNRWTKLAPATIFLQGDSPRHVDLEAVPAFVRRFVSECWSYASLNNHMQHAATFRTRINWPIPLSTYCELWRSFERGPPSAADGTAAEELCPLWSSVAWASFVVARRTIHHRPRATYERWLHSFEAKETASALWPPSSRLSPFHKDPLGDLKSDDPSARWGATFFERAWTLIFGCSAAVTGCAYTPRTSRSELFSRCPMSDAIAPESSYQTSNNARVFTLVKGEIHPSGCRAIHRLAMQNDTRQWVRCRTCST